MKKKDRKKPYTPLFKKPCQDKRSKEKLGEINALRKERGDTELLRLVLDLAKKGANLITIIEAINMNPERRNENIIESNKKRKDFIKNKRVITGAIKLLSNIKPFPAYTVLGSPFSVEQLLNLDEFNKKLPGLQCQLKKVMGAYIELMSCLMAEHEKGKPLTQKSPLWNNSIMLLVDELKRIGYSDNKAFEIAAHLLNMAYPYIYKDPDPDRLRQRYTYHKNKITQ